jgi:8-oxo-dGTP pyrophosphatase MutT (NUDIX family)
VKNRSANNPWTTLASKPVYDNPWIAVREDQVLRPDGTPGIYGVVQFKNRAVGVLAYEEGDIYLVGQFRYTLNQYSWEIPEGGCPEDEDPLDAAKRELQEETGFTASNWELLGTSHLSNSVSDELALWYLATDLTPGERKPDGTEELEVRRVRVDEALRMVLSGDITDAISMMAILQLALQSGTACPVANHALLEKLPFKKENGSQPA